MSGADMSSRPCHDLPRQTWQNPLSREPAVAAMIASTGGSARRSRPADESFRLASAEDDEAEPSRGPQAPRAVRIHVPVCLLAPFGGGGP